MKRIRVEICTSKETSFHEYEYCPIYFGADIKENVCPLGAGSCTYGLTATEPPKLCPMRLSGIKMKFNIVTD